LSFSFLSILFVTACWVIGGAMVVAVCWAAMEKLTEWAAGKAVKRDGGKMPSTRRRRRKP